MTGSAGQRRVPENFLAKLEIPLPPLAEQRRIAEVLDRAEALRAKRRAALAQLDSLTQSLFLDLFGDPATNPKGWPIRQLDEVVKEGTIVTYGIVQAGEEFPGGVPYIRTGDIVDGEIVTAGLRHTDPAIAAKFRRSRVETGDIVMSIRATVGTTALVPPQLDGANLTQGTGKISPGESTDRLYLLNYLRASGTQHWISLQIKGATFREITLTRLRELPVAVPPIPLQREFARRVTAVEALKTAQRASLAELDALFATLQHRAFRGEL
jgi:type I restriction enzyme S subunit